MAAAMLLMSATGTVFATQGNGAETQDSFREAPYVVVSVNGEAVVMYTDEGPVGTDEAGKMTIQADEAGKDALKDILNRVENESPSPDLNVLLEILDPETAPVQNEVQQAANSQRSVANQLIQGLRSSRSLNETGELARPTAASGAL